jgi:hypothetical protein
MFMKKLATCTLTLAALIGTSFAGHEMATGKGYENPVTPCFSDREVQVDIFGSYNDAVQRSPYRDGFGGGLALTYFFMRYLGVGIEGNVYDGGHGANWNNGNWRTGGGHAVWNLGGRLVARYPLEMGSTCIAPYAFAGGGAQFDGLTSGTWLAGGGLEWRATPMLGVFGEGRYTWAGNQADSAQARVGVRVVF